MSADDDFGNDTDCRGTVFVGLLWAGVGWVVVLVGAWAVWSYVLKGGE